VCTCLCVYIEISRKMSGVDNKFGAINISQTHSHITNRPLRNTNHRHDLIQHPSGIDLVVGKPSFTRYVNVSLFSSV
jgi:hypothetical protein